MLTASVLAGCPQTADSLGRSDAVGGGACTESRAPFGTQHALRYGFDADEVVAKVEGLHVSTIHWTTGSISYIRVDASEVAVWVVTSRPTDPAMDDGSCRTRTEVTARLRVTTDDERLAETIPQVRLRANGADDVYGTIVFDEAALQGSYVPVIRAQHCFRSLELRLLFAGDGVHGSIIDLLSAGTCDAPTTKLSRFHSAHWGVRWRNY